MVTLQATIIAYLDDFKFVMIVTRVAMPRLLLLRAPRTPTPADRAVVME
ncbi:putative membrane protein [Angulomicrobium tetraedrale]|uniref:Putative membrane protein n=1 Tax=Ancylobacter tetraedralis TaxID=217068 RepID=A0A839Z250_9HYPH|nr:hypothetical protein [Ancylobacter tetraedralis]MBB3770794.1 putative membrane protein [Ancylobacter tetraedralis]